MGSSDALLFLLVFDRPRRHGPSRDDPAQDVESYWTITSGRLIAQSHLNSR